MNRVVVTGIGIYSCIGTNIDSVTKSLQTGKSGIGLDLERKALGFRSSLTGVIEKPQLKGALPRRLRVGLADEGEYAYLSTVEALAGAKIDEEYLERNEIGIIFGNDSSAQACNRFNRSDARKKGYNAAWFSSCFSINELNCNNEPFLYI